MGGSSKKKKAAPDNSAELIRIEQERLNQERQQWAAQQESLLASYTKQADEIKANSAQQLSLVSQQTEAQKAAQDKLIQELQAQLTNVQKAADDQKKYLMGLSTTQQQQITDLQSQLDVKEKNLSFLSATQVRDATLADQQAADERERILRQYRLQSLRTALLSQQSGNLGTPLNNTNNFLR